MPTTFEDGIIPSIHLRFISCRSFVKSGGLDLRSVDINLALMITLQRLALYWFHALGQQLDKEVSQSTDQPHGAVCHQHYTVTGPVRERLQAGTEDAPVLERRRH